MISKVKINLEFIFLRSLKFIQNYIKPTDPAVNPTIRKKVNSSKSLGNELTNKLI